MSDELGFTLTVNSRDFDVKLSNAGKLLSTFGQRSTSAARDAKKLDTSLLGIGSSAQNSVIFLGMLNSAIATVKSSFVGWQAAILNTAGKLERLQVMLKGMANEADKAGQAQREMNQLLDMARHAPFSLDALSNSYVKLRTTGIEPAKNTLQAMTDAVARFGADDELLKRATIAIQQMAGKGVVSMEELRQQLGEAVPSAMRKMAYSMGVSVGQLAKTVSTGTVEATYAIRAMMNELQMSNMNAAANLMVTWDGMLSRLRTNAMVLAKTIADSGYMDTMKEVVQDLTDIMGSEQATAWAKKFGAAIQEVVTFLRSMLTWLNENSAALISMGQKIAAIWAASKIFGILSGSLAALAKAANGVSLAFGTIRTTIAVFTSVQSLLGTFPALFAVITRAFLGLVSVMSANPLVMALTAVAGAAYVLWEWFGRVEKKARDAAAAIREMPSSMTDADAKAMRTTLGDTLKELEKLQARKTRIQGRGEGTTATARANRKQELADIEEEIKKAEALRDEMVKALQEGSAARAESALAKQLEAENKQTDEAVTELSRTYEAGADVLERKIADLEKRTDLDPSVRKQQLEEIRAEQKELAESITNQQLALQQARYDAIKQERERLVKEINDPATTDALKLQFEKQVGILQQQEDRWLDFMKNTRLVLSNLKNQYSGFSLIGGGQEKDSYLTSLRNQADSMVESLAAAQAKAKGVGSEEAKTLAKLTNDERNLNIKTRNPEQEKEAQRLLAAAREKDKLDAAKEAEQAAKQAATEAKQAAAEMRRNYKEMERAIDAGERMAETVSFAGTTMQKFDKDLSDTTAGLQKLIAAAQTSEGQKYISPEKVAEAEEMLKVLRERAGEYRKELQNSSTEQLIDKWAPFSNEIIDRGKQTQAELRKQWNKDADESIVALNRMIEANKDNAEVRLLLEDQLNKTLLMRNSAFVNEVGTQAEQLVEVYKEVADQIDEAVGGAFEDLTDQLVDFCETGKFDFGAFGDFVFDELTRIFIRSQIMAPLMESLGIGKESTTGAGFLGGLSTMWSSLTGSGGAGEKNTTDGTGDALSEVADAAESTTSALGELQNKGIFATLTAYAQQVWQWITGTTVKSAETSATLANTSAEATHTAALIGATIALESFSAALVQAAATSATTSFFADGGIMSPAGSLPLKMYANGGIATEPQLALFGEGRHNEAFVPLPDGRSIPVSFTDAPGRGESVSAGDNADGGVSINIDVVYQNGETKEKTSEKGEADKWAEVAQRVKVIVLSTIADEKRNGGMLAGA